MTVVALDFDGTIADDDGHLCPEAEKDLPLYRSSYDIQIVICTGRRLVDVEPEVREFKDAIVAENGGVVDWGDKIEIGEPLSDNVKQLTKFHFPESQYDLRRTIAFIDCHPDNFPGEFMSEVLSTGYELVRNNDTAAIKPPEYTKSNGLRHAMAYRHNNQTIIAAGDSENDLDLLTMADHALTPANGDPEIINSKVGGGLYRGDEEYYQGIDEELHRLVSLG